MKKIFIALVAFAMFASCSSSRQTTYQETDFQINFGKSGGFTGAADEYIITGDGNIFKTEGEDKVFVNKLHKKQFKEIKTLLEETAFKEIDLSERGNMTYFIEVKTPEYSNKVMWGMTNEDTKVVQEIYNKLAVTLKD